MTWKKLAAVSVLALAPVAAEAASAPRTMLLSRPSRCGFMSSTAES